MRFKEYKGFYVFNDVYYILKQEVNNIDNFDFKNGYLIEKKDCNREVIKLIEYIGNKRVYDAIDVYYIHKDLDIPKQPHSLILDYWFNYLKLDANSFISIWGNRIEYNNICYIEFKKHYIDFRSKDERMIKFITDERIDEFWNILKITKKIKNSKSLLLENLI